MLVPWCSRLARHPFTVETTGFESPRDCKLRVRAEVSLPVSFSRINYFKNYFCINSARFRVVGEGNNLKPKATRILESYIKSIFTLVQIQYAEQPEGRWFESITRNDCKWCATFVIHLRRRS